MNKLPRPNEDDFLLLATLEAAGFAHVDAYLQHMNEDGVLLELMQREQTS